MRHQSKKYLSTHKISFREFSFHKVSGTSKLFNCRLPQAGTCTMVLTVHEARLLKNCPLQSNRNFKNFLFVVSAIVVRAKLQFIYRIIVR